MFLLRAVIHLRQADFENARTEALRATSLSPSSPDVLLVRAQVELESADNLTEGRWLLEQAFETTKQSLPESRWPSLQKPFAQNLATFQYFLAEAADVSGDDAVTLAETVDRQKTKLSQDHRRLSLLREAMSGIGR